MNSPVILVIGLVAVGLIPVIAAISFMGRDPHRAKISRSLASIEDRYAQVYDAARREPLTSRIGGPLMHRLGNLGKILTPKGAIGKMQRRLDLAGNPPRWPVERVIAAKGVVLVVGLVLGSLFGLLIGGGMRMMLCAIFGSLVGFFLPDMMIYNNGTKRQDDIALSLPDVLDTLTISVEAGQGFDAAMAQVSRNGRGPMVGETARVLQEMRIGKTRVEALRAMGERTTVSELKGFASSVVQASELGVPVANVLREQAREMRLRRRQRAEEMAQKIPIKILFPTMFCLFPALFVVVIGPGVLNVMAQFSGR